MKKQLHLLKIINVLFSIALLQWVTIMPVCSNGSIVGWTVPEEKLNFAASEVTPDINGIVYVDGTVATSGNGGSWTQALKLLSDATVAAETNTAIKEIYVAKGTYYPTGLPTENNRDSSFAVIRGGLKIYGGYPNGGGTRDYLANPTVLSGDINLAGDSLDNSYHVLVIAGVPADADSVVVDGFRIEGGYGEGNFNNAKDYNGLTLNPNRGAGIALIGVYGNTTIRNSTITRNTALYGTGGGIYNKNSFATLTNLSIIHNHSHSGAGVYNEDSSPSISHTHLDANVATGHGGGIYDASSSAPILTNSTIRGNSAYSGGGVSSLQAAPEFFNVIISGNTAGEGAGMYIQSSSPVFTNVTISGNRAEGAGGGIFTTSSSPRFINSIIWGNSAHLEDDLRDSGSGEDEIVSIYHTLINIFSKPIKGKGVLHGNPKFVDAPDASEAPFIGGDYRLLPGSPVINRGSNDAIPAWDSTDLAGNSRIYGLDLGGIVDLGSYESTDGEFVLPDEEGVLYVDGSVASPGNGSSWENALQFLSEATEVARSNTYIKEIRVAEGTYYPTGSQNGTGRGQTFFIEGSLKLYGGYSSGGGARDFQANPTILSGDIGVPGDTTDNSYHVMILGANPESSDSLIVDGFTLTGGNANQYSWSPAFAAYGLGIQDIYGGGLLATQLTESTAIRNCTFTENYARSGGGIAMFDSSPLIADCDLKSNHVINMNTEGFDIENSGGAMVNFNSSPTIERCIFLDNSAPTAGAIANEKSSPAILNSTFSGNTGNGVSLILNQESTPVFVNSLFTENYTTGPTDLPIPQSFILNFLFSETRLVNCTVSGNHIPSGSAAFIMNVYQSSVTVDNSIIYGNEGINKASIDTLFGESLFRHSLIQGIAADENNLAGNTDPHFIDSANGNYRLQACSPLINKGDNAQLSPGLTLDADGNPRITHAIIDLGAFEFQDALPTGGATLGSNNDEITKTITGLTEFYGNDESCRLIARVEPTGLDPVSGSVTARVEVDPEVATHNGSPYVQRHYLINAQSGESARITLYFTQTEFDNFNGEILSGYLPGNPTDSKNNIRIYQFHGETGSTPGDYEGAELTVITPLEEDIIWDDINQRWEISFHVEGFSGFFLGSSSSPLPVRLVSFSGKVEAENSVGLNWEVAEQQDIATYTVEYSPNGTAFEDAGMVAASQTKEARYSFNHLPAKSNEIAYYRLRISEVDGSHSYSQIISLKLSGASLASVYPVPANEGFWLETKGAAGATARLRNIQGRVVKMLTLSSDKTYVDISVLPSGIYFITVGDRKTIKISKK